MIKSALTRLLATDSERGFARKLDGLAIKTIKPANEIPDLVESLLISDEIFQTLNFSNET
jgi:hypothetical protein